MDLAATITSLEAERERHRAEADKLDRAIAALRGLGAPPPAAATPPRTGTWSHPELAGKCEREGCDKTFPISKLGRRRTTCSAYCRNAVNKAKRKAAPLEDALRPRESIPESGSGMKARIAQMVKGGVIPKSRFLEQAKARNEAAAKRSAAGR
jgi:hypothetical protein